MIVVNCAPSDGRSVLEWICGTTQARQGGDIRGRAYRRVRRIRDQPVNAVRQIWVHATQGVREMPALVALVAHGVYLDVTSGGTKDRLVVLHARCTVCNGVRPPTHVANRGVWHVLVSAINAPIRMRLSHAHRANLKGGDLNMSMRRIPRDAQHIFARWWGHNARYTLLARLRKCQFIHETYTLSLPGVFGRQLSASPSMHSLPQRLSSYTSSTRAWNEHGWLRRAATSAAFSSSFVACV
jgi:hypothetical protein